MSLRDEIRAKTIGAAKQFKKEIVRANDINIEIRQISIGDRMLIGDQASFSRAGTNGATKPDKFNPKRAFGILAMLKMCYVPGTDELVFEDTDVDGILAQPPGGWYDELLEHCMALLNVGKETEKNAATSTTEPGSGSSPLS